MSYRVFPGQPGKAGIKGTSLRALACSKQPRIKNKVLRNPREERQQQWAGRASRQHTLMC